MTAIISTTSQSVDDALADLAALPARAAAGIRGHGWKGTRGRAYDRHGRVSLLDALRGAHQAPGDWALILGILDRQRTGLTWESQNGRTEAEVVDMLRSLAVDDSTMCAVYGPGWIEARALINRLAAVTDSQREQISEAWDGTRPWRTDLPVQSAIRLGFDYWTLRRREDAISRAVPEFVQVGGFAHCTRILSLANAAARNPMWALSMRDRIEPTHLEHDKSEHRFDHDTYMATVWPIASVLGPLHPADQPIR
ncbi:hypothetical protein GS531_00365 [Rhodococcus hoagii]|nr:hypothetical protein [Prescottella equi]